MNVYIEAVEGRMMDKPRNPFRSFLRRTLTAVPVLLALTFFSCSEREVATSGLKTLEKGPEENDSGVSEEEEISQEDQIDIFVTDELLGGIKFDKMYEAENLKNTFGKYIEQSQESARIDYEGMKGDHLNKYRYDKFDLVFYVVRDNREIFAYLNVHEGVTNPIGDIGASMATLELKYGNKLRKWSDTLYTLGLSGRNYLSGVTLLAESGLLKAIEINLGEI